MVKLTEIVTKILLLALFVFTAWAKLSSPEVFVDALKAYQLFPESVIPLLVFYVPILELLLAGGLLAPKFSREALTSSLGLMVVFEILLLSFLMRGLEGDCGCFGKFGGTPFWSFIKNLFIIGLISYTLYVTRNKAGDVSTDR